MMIKYQNKMHSSNSSNKKQKRTGKDVCIHETGYCNGGFRRINLLDASLPKEGRETVQAIYQDKVEDLIVPSRKPVDVPIVLSSAQFLHFKKKAHVVTVAERLSLLEEAERKKRLLEAESAQRKQQLQRAEQEQSMRPGAKLTRLEDDSKQKTNYLLQRAFELRQEQEDEVKRANQLILASKCLAIRAAQVAEAQLIKKELADEDARLDNMMEEQRRKALETEENQRQKERKRKQRFVNEMMEQIHEKEVERLQEGERIEEEARAQNRALLELQRSEEEKRLQKVKQQVCMREEMARANRDLTRYKELQAEEQRVADLRVREFMRRRAEREAAREQQAHLAHLAKERETARLRALQERQQDRQAARDEMNALRVQEEVEREWRRSERMRAEKKRRDEAQLREAREQQIDDIRKKQAIELEREKQDFQKIVRVQQTLRQKELAEEKKRKDNSEKHRKEILQQVNEKERQRIDRQREKFDEGVALRAELQIRERNIQQTLQNKMNSLRFNRVPEPVVKDIERQLKLTSV